MFNKLNEIILAENINRSINSNDVIQLLNTDYSQAVAMFKSKQRIYRGVNNKTDNDLSNIIECHPVERRASQTLNVYNYFMSELLPSWKDYPKRSESVICSTNLIYATSFCCNNKENVYCVFPKNNAKLGICPRNDLWSSFGINNKDGNEFQLYSFNSMIVSFLTTCNIIFKINDDDILDREIEDKSEWVATYFKEFDSANIMQCINNCNNIMRTEKYDNSFKYCEDNYSGVTEFINKIHECNDDIILAIDSMLNTKTNGFKLKTLAENTRILSGVEVWTDSLCLMIKYNEIQNYID